MNFFFFQKLYMRKNVRPSMTPNVKLSTTLFKRKNAKLVMKPNVILNMKPSMKLNAPLNIALNMKRNMKPNVKRLLSLNARLVMRPSMRPSMNKNVSKFRSNNAHKPMKKYAKLNTRRNTKRSVTNLLLNKTHMEHLKRLHWEQPPIRMEPPKPRPIHTVPLKLP